MDWFNCTCVKHVRVYYGYWIKYTSKLFLLLLNWKKNVRETNIKYYFTFMFVIYKFWYNDNPQLVLTKIDQKWKLTKIKITKYNEEKGFQQLSCHKQVYDCHKPNPDWLFYEDQFWIYCLYHPIELHFYLCKLLELGMKETNLFLKTVFLWDFFQRKYKSNFIYLTHSTSLLNAHTHYIQF